MHETCRQYVDRRLSEGWRVVSLRGHYLILSTPDGNMLRTVDLRNDVETLRPNAPGDETNLTIAGLAPAETNWESVDEAISDGSVTIVTKGTSDYRRDLYNIENHSEGSGTIHYIKVYARCRATMTPDQTSLKIAIKSTNVHESTEKTVTTVWAPYTEQWDTNPDNAHAWTWDEIDALQIGIALRKAASFVSTQCTQVYVEVDYTPGAPTTGWKDIATRFKLRIVVLPTVITNDATEITTNSAKLWGEIVGF